MRISDSKPNVDNPKIRALHMVIEALHKLSQDLHNAADQALKEHARKNRPFRQKVKDFWCRKWKNLK